MGRPNYRKNPITEAVVDIRVKSSESRTDALLPIHTAVKEQYPSADPLNVFQTQFAFGQAGGSTTLQRHLGYILKSRDQKHICQIRTDGFAFSRLAPYDRWELFCDEARRLWNFYNESITPESIVRIAIRYINRFDLPGPLVEFRDYFRTYPEIGDKLPQTVNNSLLRLEIPYDDAVLNLTQMIVPPYPGAFCSIVLDLDLYREGINLQIDEKLWENHLEQLHSKLDHVFESCITDRTRELIK